MTVTFSAWWGSFLPPKPAKKLKISYKTQARRLLEHLVEEDLHVRFQPQSCCMSGHDQKIPPPKKKKRKKTKMSSASHCPSHPGCLGLKKSFPLKSTFLRHSLVTVLGRGRAAFYTWSEQKIHMKTARQVDVRTEGVYETECCQRTC